MSDDPTDSLRRTPSTFRNYLSFAGAALAFAAFTSIVLLFLLELSTGARDNPYLGIFAYIAFPAVLVVGLLLIPAGMLWERRRRRRLGSSETPSFPVIDLNDPRRRRAFLVFLSFSFLFVCVSAFGSYRAYEYTESVAFCGQLCHTVMKPEFVAFQVSPHARIQCVDCHVGPGAEWYLRSKLSGARQAYGVLAGNYARPIPTPVRNLRPAQETCETCHWPEKYFGTQLKVFSHYGYDESNTVTRTRLLVRTGGGSQVTGLVSGIHWHMNIANEVTYIASDAQRQEIPWVRMKSPNGDVTEYTAPGETLTREQIEAAPKRRMDCVDCHNRPAHVYVAPARAVDTAFDAGRLDPALPYLKREAVDALSASYGSNDEASTAIGGRIEEFYRTRYPDVFAAKRAAIDAAVGEVRRIYQTYVFPEMKVDWRTHPDEAGHFYFRGCFRCHDGEHRSASGRVIRADCVLCHTTLDQTVGGTTTVATDGGFRHPVDLGNLEWADCSKCHRGDGPFRHPLDLGDIAEFACSECHRDVAGDRSALGR